MALAKALSSTLLGVDAHQVEMEVDLAMRLPVFNTVGLPDAAVRESGDRVKAAMANCAFPFPVRRITVNLAPAYLRKAGTAFDPPIALGVLRAAGHVESDLLARYQVVGELSLDGREKAVASVLPMAVGAQASGAEGMVVQVEDGQFTIARASMALTFPARFMLAAAMNPCPCGYSTDAQRECLSTAQQLQRYNGRVSGPFLDRIDLHTEVQPPVQYADLATRAAAETSAAIRLRVNAARQRQRERFAGSGIPHNLAMGVRTIRQYCKLDAAGERLLERVMQRFGPSASGHDRSRKVARTIADRAGADDIGIEHLSEAVQYRTLDRQKG